MAGGTFAGAPLPGEAALQEAFAGLRDSASSARSGAGCTQPPPKTVAQVLGEIAWLMTQSPRHKAIALADLEWLVMPAILLLFTKEFGCIRFVGFCPLSTWWPVFCGRQQWQMNKNVG